MGSSPAARAQGSSSSGRPPTTPGSVDRPAGGPAAMTDGPADSLTIDAAAERLAEVRALIRAYARNAGADEEAVSDLVQAVDELGCNVIEHGYAGRPGSIEIALATLRDGIQVRIRDAAPPFDPRSVAEPRLDLPLDQRPLGGMGVHLARTLTDTMDHRIL